jgi:NAD(P)-dependent dehydrogenase (short-subunit alcohol dehydrogenase family)
LSVNQLKDRVAVVTGANQGFGLTIAKAFSNAGADLIICARDAEKLSAAAKEISDVKSSDRQRLLSLTADVSCPDDVERLVEHALSEFTTVHILVNNAGVYGPIGAIETVNWEDWKKAVEINLFGSVLMCRALLPHFRKNNYGKIIQISGGGATNPMPRFEAYASSKSAAVRFVESLALDCIDDHIDVNAIAPGLLDTRLLDQVLSAGPDKAGKSFYNRMLAAREEKKCTPLDIGVKLCLFLASALSDGITGRLISAVWDDYEIWPQHLEELINSDLYTLRRITGRDRGKTWGDR